MGFNGKKVLVRRQNKLDGSWSITKKGEAYFAYNRDEYLAEVHYLIGKTGKGSENEEIQRIIHPDPSEDWILPLDFNEQN